jgi:DnaA-homolog protein
VSARVGTITKNMRQLALDIRLADHAVFDSYYPGPNAVAVASMQSAAAGEGPAIIWIWAAPESGRSHLLQASVAESHDRGAPTAYLPLAGLRALSPAVLDGMATLKLLALDDVDAVAGDAGWERALFRLYEELLPRGGRLLLAAGAPPAQAGFALADLSSRLSAGAVFRLERLSDAECRLALQRRAAWRGLELTDETAEFLLTRVERSTGSLFRLLDRLDRASLAAQKRLTIPFVRSVLESAN